MPRIAALVVALVCWVGRRDNWLERAVIVVLGSALTSGCVGGDLAAIRANQKKEPSYYVCEADAKGEFGSIYYTLEVSDDGKPPLHRINWTSPDRPHGVGLHLQWLGEGPFDQRKATEADLWIKFQANRKWTGPARLEFRSGAEFSKVEFAGPNAVASRWPGDRSRFEFVTHWSDLRAWFGTNRQLLVDLVRSDGAVLDRDLLRSSDFTALDRAISATVPAAELKAKDFRHSCEPAPDIIIT